MSVSIQNLVENLLGLFCFQITVFSMRAKIGCNQLGFASSFVAWNHLLTLSPFFILKVLFSLICSYPPLTCFRRMPGELAERSVQTANQKCELLILNHPCFPVQMLLTK